MTQQFNPGDILWPYESSKYIMEKAKFVSLDDSGISKLADEIYEAIRKGELDVKRFKQTELHPKVADERAVDWIFLIDTLNFCFWTGHDEAPKWEVNYSGKNYTGYFAECGAVNRAIDEGIDMTNPNVYGTLNVDDVQKIFRSETATPIPLPEDRVKNMQEVAKVLIDKYGGSFVNCIKSCDQSAFRLLQLIVTEFPCYRDMAQFEGKSVSLFKRAQILIGDIWACFEGKGLGEFNDLDKITMFADYRIPQVLLAFDAIKYSDELLSFLNKGGIMENGDVREIEIRGASILVVEQLKEKIRSKLLENGMQQDLINSIMIDHFLWDYRRSNIAETDKFPYHKVRCIYY